MQRVRAKYAAAGRTASTKSALLARAIEDGIIGLSDLGAASHATSIQRRESERVACPA